MRKVIKIVSFDDDIDTAEWEALKDHLNLTVKAYISPWDFVIYEEGDVPDEE